MDQNTIQNLKNRILHLENEIKDIKSTLRSWEKSPQLSSSAPTGTSSSGQPSVSDRASSSSIPISPSRHEPKTKKPGKSWEDWEFLLGGNWMAKVGVVAILLATAWFLDLAFSNNWVTDSAKIYIGILFGLGFVGGSNYFSIRGFRILTPAMLGGGFSILYLSIFSAYRFYSYLGIEEAFLYLSFLSLLVIALSEYTRNEAIFIFGYFGSLLSPVLLSTGENSYRFLFVYLFVNLLLFAWASRGLQWRWAPLMVFFSHWLVFDVWMIEKFRNSSLWITLVFLFSLVGFFFYRELILESKSNRLAPFWTAKVIVVGSLLLFVGNLYYIFSVYYPDWENFSYLIGAFLCLGFVVRMPDEDYLDWKVPTLFYISLALLYFSILMQAEKSLLTFSLIAFAFLFSMMNLSSKEHIGNRIAFFFLWGIGLLRLVFVEPSEHFTTTMIWNGRFVLFLATFTGLFFLYYISKKKNSDLVYRRLFSLGALSVLLIGFLYEVHYGIYDPSLRNQGYNVVLAGFAFFFLVYGFTKSQPNFRKLGIGFLLVVIAKFALYDIWLLSLVVKIFAGFIMGILLIVLGLFYEKLKTRILGELK